MSPGGAPRVSRAEEALIPMRIMCLIRKILKLGILMNLLRK